MGRAPVGTQSGSGSQALDGNLRPSRILVIPDGHRRYAHKNEISYREAYRLGALVAAEVACKAAATHLVPHLTFYPLATKNFNERDEATIAVIFNALGTFLDAIKAKAPNIHLSHRGRLTRLPPALAERLTTFAENSQPRGLNTIEVQLLIDYDGHAELAQMSKTDMDAALARPFDIVVRTGGAFRLSGAPVLECSSADMFSLPMMFPEFTYEDLDHVVRRFVDDKKRRLHLRANPRCTD